MQTTALNNDENLTLSKLKENALLPANLVDFVTKIYTLQRMNPLPVFTKEDCSTVQTDREAFLAGTPLLSLHQMPYKREHSAQLFGKILAVVAEDEQYKEAVDIVKETLQQGALSLEEAYGAFLSNDNTFFTYWAERIPDKGNLIRFLVQSSITPSLVAFAECVQQVHDLSEWTEQYCPVCGSDPFIAYWKGSTGVQYNACSLCQTQYRVARIECMYCGENNHEQLAYIRAEEFPLFVLQTCKTCGQYGKILDYKDCDLPALPALDDILSVPMDMVAVQQGFVRPVSSAWGF